MSENKKFFVKDFIQYVTPCFGCDKPSSFYFRFEEKNLPEAPASDYTTDGRLRTTVTNKHIEVELHIRYASELKLWISHKTNKILSSNNVALSEYLFRRQLFLVGHCSLCHTEISSNALDIQLFNGVVGPTTLCSERLCVQQKRVSYILYSDFNTQTSVGTVIKYDERGMNRSELNFDMPLLPKYKIKERNKLVEKLKLYTLLS